MKGNILVNTYEESTGWDKSSLLELALDFIEEQGKRNEFFEFLDTQADEEASHSVMEG